MGPLVFWLGSILESFIFTRLNSRRLYKDLADRGYKLKYMDGREKNSIIIVRGIIEALDEADLEYENQRKLSKKPKDN